MLNQQAELSLLDIIFIIVLILLLFSEPIVEGLCNLFFGGLEKILEHVVFPFFDSINKIGGTSNNKNEGDNYDE